MELENFIEKLFLGAYTISLRAHKKISIRVWSELLAVLSVDIGGVLPTFLFPWMCIIGYVTLDMCEKA